MKCKVQDCENSTVKGRKYCDLHLCNYKYTKSTGERCQKKKMGKQFCFIHTKYIYGKVSLINLVLSVLITILITTVFTIYGEDISRYTQGYDLKIDFLENKEDIYNKGGKNFAVVEVQNIGGYDLHNVKGELNFFCRNKDLKDFGSAKFEGPIQTLSYNSEPKAFLFDNETLIRYIQSGIGDCFDAVIEVIHPVKINESTAEVKEIEIYGYNLETDSFSYNLIKGNTASWKLCAYCNISVNIYTKEKNFSYFEEHKFNKFSLDSSTYPNLPAYLSEYTFTRIVVMPSNFTNFTNDQETFKNYVENKLIKDNLVPFSKDTAVFNNSQEHNISSGHNTIIIKLPQK